MIGVAGPDAGTGVAREDYLRLRLRSFFVPPAVALQTWQSTGMDSPARIATRQPGSRLSSGTSRVSSPSMRRAVAGASALSRAEASMAARWARR